MRRPDRPGSPRPRDPVAAGVPGRLRAWGRRGWILSAAALAAAAAGARSDDAPAPQRPPVFFREPDATTKKAIDVLITQFSSDSVRTRQRARDELVGFGYWSVDPLLQATRKQESPVKCSAILTLDALGDRRALAPLREVVLREDGNPYVAAFAALALGRFRDRDAVDPFRTALARPRDLDLFRAAVPLALARLRTPEALALLREQVADEAANESVTSARLLALGFFPDAALDHTGERPGAELLTALSSRRRGERQAALIAFLVATARGSQGKGFLLETIDADHPPVVQAVALLGLAAFDESDVTERIARAALGSGPDELREYACELLVDRKDPAALPALLRLVSTNQTARLRATAVLAMSKIDLPAARDAILARISDTTALVRAAAAVAAARAPSAELRAKARTLIEQKLHAGQSDAKVREVFQTARAVLADERRDVVWPEVGAEHLFHILDLPQRLRLLRAVNRRAETSLDLLKIQNLQVEGDLTPDAPPTLNEGVNTPPPLEGIPGEGTSGGVGPTPGDPPATQGGAVGAARTSAWQELRDLKVELGRRPYFTLEDLPTPPAAPTGEDKQGAAGAPK